MQNGRHRAVWVVLERRQVAATVETESFVKLWEPRVGSGGVESKVCVSLRVRALTIASVEGLFLNGLLLCPLEAYF